MHCFEDDPWSPGNLRPDPADAHVYGDVTAVHRELERLGDLHTQWRDARRAITELWIVVLGMGMIMLVTSWWWLSVPAAGLALYAVRVLGRTDVSGVRGHELEADIAMWRERRRKLLDGGAR